MDDDGTVNYDEEGEEEESKEEDFADLFNKDEFKQFLKNKNALMTIIEKFILKHNITIISFKLDYKNIIKLLIIQIINDLVDNCIEKKTLYKKENYYILNNFKIPKKNLINKIIINFKAELISLINLYKDYLLLKLNLYKDEEEKQKSMNTIKHNDNMLKILDGSMNVVNSKLSEIVTNKMNFLYKQNKIKTTMFQDLNKINMDEFEEIDKQDELIEDNIQLQKIYEERKQEIKDNQAFIQHESNDVDASIKDLEKGYKELKFNNDSARKDMEYIQLTQKTLAEGFESMVECSQQIHTKMMSANEAATETINKGINDSTDIRIKSIAESGESIRQGINSVNDSLLQVKETIKELNVGVGNVIKEFENFKNTIIDTIKNSNGSSSSSSSTSNPTSNPSIPTRTKIADELNNLIPGVGSNPNPYNMTYTPDTSMSDDERYQSLLQWSEKLKQEADTIFFNTTFPTPPIGASQDLIDEGNELHTVYSSIREETTTNFFAYQDGEPEEDWAIRLANMEHFITIYKKYYAVLETKCNQPVPNQPFPLTTFPNQPFPSQPFPNKPFGQLNSNLPPLPGQRISRNPFNFSNPQQYSAQTMLGANYNKTVAPSLLQTSSQTALENQLLGLLS